jgi:lipopolysaccharide transport system permease protein
VRPRKLERGDSARPRWENTGSAVREGSKGQSRGPAAADGRPPARGVLRLPLVQTWRQRALVLALARRELAARYRGGILGFFWSLVNPLLLLAVYAVVFHFVFAARADVRPYALFLFAGVLTWGFVSSALLDAAETFRQNGPLLRKTTVAPEVFPAVAVAARLAHFVLALPVLAAATAFAAARGQVAPGLAALELPLVLGLLVVAVFGLALGISALAVHFADIRDVVGNVLTLAFFATPVLYPVDAVPERFRPFLRANPFAAFLTAIHDTVFFFRPVAPGDWLVMLATAAACLAIGSAIFERLRDSIAEEA